MVDLQANRGEQLVATVSVFLVLTVISIFLRFLSRRVARVKLWWDDYLIILALVCWCIGYVCDIYDYRNGVGKHIQTVPPGDIGTLLLWVYINEIVYYPLLTAVKCSILCLYIRLLGANKTFLKVSYFLIGLSIIWGVAGLLATIFQCTPIKGAWHPELAATSKCFNLTKFLLGTGVPNVVISLGILVTPIPVIWNLNLDNRRKAGLSAIFLLGTFEVVVSVVRIVFISNINEQDITWDYFNAIVWSSVEACVAMICACLPTMAPLVQYAFGRRFGRQNSSKKYLYPQKGTNVSSSSNSRHFSRLADGNSAKAFAEKRGTTPSHDEENDSFPLNSIQVTRDAYVHIQSAGR